MSWFVASKVKSCHVVRSSPSGQAMNAAVTGRGGWLTALCCATLVMGFTGCGNGGGNSQAVAIVNLDKVLKMTGADLEINNAIQDRETQIRNGLANFQQQLEDALNKKKTEFGETPSEDQKQELQAFQSQLIAQNQQARNQANQSLNNFQQELLESFQQQVSPISLEVAKEKGYAIVLGQNPSILAFDTTIDITDEVIARMKQARSDTGLATGQTPGSDGPLRPAAPSGQVPVTPPLKSVEPSGSPQLETSKPEEKPETPAKSNEKPAVPETGADKTETPTNTEAPAKTEPSAKTESPEKTETPASEPTGTSDKPASENN